MARKPTKLLHVKYCNRAMFCEFIWDTDVKVTNFAYESQGKLETRNHVEIRPFKSEE